MLAAKMIEYSKPTRRACLFLASAIFVALFAFSSEAQAPFEPNAQQRTGGYNQAAQDSGRNQQNAMLSQIAGWRGHFTSFEELFGNQSGFSEFARDFDAVIDESMLRIAELSHVSEATRAEYVGAVFEYMNETRQAVMFDLLYHQFFIDGGNSPEDLPELNQETQAMMALEGLGERQLLEHIFSIHRLAPFEPPSGMDVGVALTLSYPADLSRPLAVGWKDDADPIQIRLELTNRSDEPRITVKFTIETDTTILLPPGGTATCIASFRTHDCMVEIAQGTAYVQLIALRPGRNLSAPFSHDEVVRVEGTASTPGHTDTDIPPSQISLPFRDCDAAFTAAIDNLETGFGALTLEQTAIAAHQTTRPLPHMTGKPIFALPSMRESRGAVDIAARMGLERPQPNPTTLNYEDMTARQQVIYVATQTMRLRGRDAPLRDEHERIVAYQDGQRASTHMLGATHELPQNACPGVTRSSMDLPARVRLMQRSFAWIEPRRQEISELVSVGTQLRDRHIAKFEEARGQLGTEPNDGALLVDLPTYNTETFDQIGPFVTGATRTLVNFSLSRLVQTMFSNAAGGWRATVYAASTLTGPFATAINLWNLANISLDAAVAYDRFRTAVRWIETISYLQLLEQRYRMLEAEYPKVVDEYRALTMDACDCRYE